KNIMEYIIEKDNYRQSIKKTAEKNYEELHNIAEKRYNIILKHESDSMKIYGKLWRFLMTKGYSSDDVKQELKKLINVDK
ncbi:MAG: RecX family transcriptional regulator, partial [Clostridium sp.]